MQLLEKVDSSLIAAIGYDPVWQLLFVEFKKSKKQEINPVYTYEPFTPERWAAFKAEQTTLGGSLGVHFLQKIKTDATLKVTRISPEPEPTSE